MSAGWLLAAGALGALAVLRAELARRADGWADAVELELERAGDGGPRCRPP